MMRQSRRQLLIKAVQEAAIDLAAKLTAARYAALPDEKPTPDEVSAAAAARKAATGGTFLDKIDEDELWVAYAINSSGRRYAGLGRTTAEAKANAWINSHWPGGTPTALVQVSKEVPDGWTFELFPPPKRKPEMLAISALAIFELVQRKIPDVTPDEINYTIMQSLPYMGGRRH